MKKYFPIENENGRYIKVQVYYSLGGYNYFTYETEKRGIWLSISPVELSRGMESYVAFSGNKVCLEELKRSSKKTLAKWEAKIDAIAEDIAKAFTEKNGARIMELIKAA